MTTIPNLPLDSFSPRLLAQVAAGSLFLPVGPESDGIRMAIAGDDCALAARLDPTHDRAFKAYNVDRSHEVVLPWSDWSLEVDPESGYSAFNGSPAIGDAFVCEGSFGFVMSLDHSTAYVTAEGAIIDGPNWGTGTFLGFKKWVVLINSHSDRQSEILRRQ